MAKKNNPKDVIYLMGEKSFREIDRTVFAEKSAQYMGFTKTNTLRELPKTKEVIEMIHYAKRKLAGEQHAIGAYANITVFEAANRIASDLVILKGIKDLLESYFKDDADCRITMHLGTAHVKGEGDFIIHSRGNEFHGEAFNVAESFFKAKLDKTLTKWKEDKDGSQNKLRYILVNIEATDDMESAKAKAQLLNIEVIGVRDWDKVN